MVVGRWVCHRLHRLLGTAYGEMSSLVVLVLVVVLLLLLVRVL